MVGGWGIYSPNHQTSRLVGLSVAWCTGQSGAPAMSPKPLGFDHWIPDAGPAWMSGGAPDMHCRVSGAPAWACLTSARAGAHLMRPQVAIGAEVVVAPLLHRTVRCTPTCPVNYSGAAVAVSRGCQVPEPHPLGAPDTVRCTPDMSGEL
jgi:hypothetical protein